mgnify:CR=1 FL=1
MLNAIILAAEGGDNSVFESYPRALYKNFSGITILESQINVMGYCGISPDCINVVIGGWKYKDNFISLSNFQINQEITNTKALGNVLYTDYIHLFQISGMILLISMIGAIALTFQKKDNVKRQNYIQQIKREKITAVSLVDVKSGEGVKIHD